jgi:septal ring factor EnvC (AmiA/AmiB activator)
MKVKTQLLKEVRSRTQELIELSNKKEDEATEIKIKFQEEKSHGEVLRVEEDRLRLQIAQLREEVEKTRRENSSIRNQN